MTTSLRIATVRKPPPRSKKPFVMQRMALCSLTKHALSNSSALWVESPTFWDFRPMILNGPRGSPLRLGLQPSTLAAVGMRHRGKRGCARISDSPLRPDDRVASCGLLGRCVAGGCPDRTRLFGRLAPAALLDVLRLSRLRRGVQSYRDERGRRSKQR